MKPSTTPNTQISATMLMTSGTITKKPGDEPPPQPLHHPCIHPAAIAASSATPSAMRYHANGANPDRLTKCRNGLMTSSDERNAMTRPTAISRPRAGDSSCRDLEQIVRERRCHGRHRQEERELRRRRAIQPSSNAADDGGAGARDARESAPALWHTPMPNARGQRRALGVQHDRRWPHAARRATSRCRRR